MKQTTIGGNKRKLMNGLAVALLVVIFIAYMFPFLMVVINSLKQKRDIIKSPFSWLFTIKGLSFDNFVKAFTQMDFLNAFKNSLFVTVSATVLVTLLAAMLAKTFRAVTYQAAAAMARAMRPAMSAPLRG